MNYSVKIDTKCFAAFGFICMAAYNYMIYLRTGVCLGNRIFRSKIRLANFKFYTSIAIISAFSYMLNFPKNSRGLIISTYYSME